MVNKKVSSSPLLLHLLFVQCLVLLTLVLLFYQRRESTMTTKEEGRGDKEKFSSSPLVF